MIRPVILSGGAGTRLWPLSRKSLPKQFVELFGGKSLLQTTLERVRRFHSMPVIVAADEHRFLVAETLRQADIQAEVILEPCSRNTAAAMTVAALQVGRNTDELLLFCPSDHHVPDDEAFAQAVQSGIRAAEDGCIVTLGIRPTFPSSAYGYIEQGSRRADGSFSVQRFIEKPAVERATQLIQEGRVLWNAGIFLCSPAVLLDALAVNAPDILEACTRSMDGVVMDAELIGQCRFVQPSQVEFDACRSQSIDFAVMEKCQGLAVVEFAGAWSDVGSWNAVADLSELQPDGNRVHGRGVFQDCRNSFIHASDRPVAALGVSDLLIVDTPDAVMVVDRTRVEQVKELVGRLHGEGVTEAVAHRKVIRPWGWYDSIDQGDRFKVKRISVKVGGALSLQRHRYRAEHWVVVKGTAEVTCGVECFLLGENESTYIPKGVVHRLRNAGPIDLEVIEVQSGELLTEDDIERYEDSYGRVK